MSINACDTKGSTLLSLLSANIRILSCLFFLLLVKFCNFLTTPAVSEKKVRLALAIPAGAPAILVNEIIDTPPVAALKTIKILSM